MTVVGSLAVRKVMIGNTQGFMDAKKLKTPRVQNGKPLRLSGLA